MHLIRWTCGSFSLLILGYLGIYSVESTLENISSRQANLGYPFLSLNWWWKEREEEAEKYIHCNLTITYLNIILNRNLVFTIIIHVTMFEQRILVKLNIQKGVGSCQNYKNSSITLASKQQIHKFLLKGKKGCIIQLFYHQLRKCPCICKNSADKVGEAAAA